MKMIEHWVNVYEDYTLGSFYYDKATADRAAKLVLEEKKIKRMKCHKVNIPENIKKLKQK